MQTNISKHNNAHAVWWHLNSRSPTAPVFEVTVAVFLDLEVCTNVQVTWLKIKQNVLEKDHSPGDGGHFLTITWPYIRGCAIGQSVVFLLPCSVSVTNQWLTCTQAHREIAQEKQGKWLERSTARGIRRKAGRPNVLWAKIYIQRESAWEWLGSPIILLRATHNQSYVHIRDLKQIAAASSIPRSWMQRPGESTSP